MKELPKIHKAGIPLRSITSGIGSAPHKLAKVLAKPLSSALGNISNSHLQNSTDLIERLNNINFPQKRLGSYDITSLFTNVFIIGAIDAIKEALQTIDERSLPIGKRDYMQLIERCMKFGSFKFNNQEYHQLGGLPMGSPLSAEAASLYLEVLERDYFLEALPKEAHWFSAHDERTKVGVVIGFFPRALRICSREFLDDEVLRIKSTFRALGYPEGLLSTFLRKLLGDAVLPLGLEVVSDTGKRIKQVVTPTSSTSSNLGIIYKIPCGGSDKSYYRESYRGLETRIREHKADLRYH
ncbi:uncharacterized protein LOC143037189 [Oratosquilla oratoria]|uniref:uncharacterized protein LOC143037189 n=1 Tax=Oratosquilla oratoria TaxID=337810 RepID=UPI003F75ECFE